MYNIKFFLILLSNLSKVVDKKIHISLTINITCTNTKQARNSELTFAMSKQSNNNPTIHK